MRPRIDWVLVGAALGLLAIGTLVMLSAASLTAQYPQILRRHFIALFLGCAAFLVGIGLNYQIFQDQSRILYGCLLAMMVMVLLFGITQRGHRSWFQLPFFRFQPVELARVGIVLVLANYLDKRARKAGEVSTLFWSMMIAGPIMALVLKQPDFASMLTFFPLLLGMLFCAGANLAHVLVLAGVGGLALSYPLLYILCQIHYPNSAQGSWAYFFLQTARFGWSTFAAAVGFVILVFAAWRLAVMARLQAKGVYFLVIGAVIVLGLLTGVLLNRQIKGYQRNRIVAFLAPQEDIRGASYNVNQSQIAIGSGGFWGKGLFSGTQGQLGFLPERHTDFIFAVVGEEMGFIGALGLLLLYLIMIWRITEAARLSRDRYGYLVCAGLASLYGFHLILNVGMCVGLMPVAGIPLPLVSYGGSSLVVTLWSLGVVNNIYARRYSFL